MLRATIILYYTYYNNHLLFTDSFARNECWVSLISKDRCFIMWVFVLNSELSRTFSFILLINIESAFSAQWSLNVVNSEGDVFGLRFRSWRILREFMAPIISTDHVYFAPKIAEQNLIKPGPIKLCVSKGKLFYPKLTPKMRDLIPCSINLLLRNGIAFF